MVIRVFLSPVNVQEDRPVLRKLSDQHDHSVAQERGGRAGVQRVWALHQITRGE